MLVQVERQLTRRFALVVVGSISLYALLTWMFWLPTYLPRGRASIGTITERSTEGAITLALIGVALYSLYIVGAILLWRFRPRYAAQLIWLGAVVAALVLLWSYPATSTDLFDYVFRARMAVEYDANPYLALPNQFKNDRFFRYVGWPNAPSAYGPLWELISQGVVLLGGTSLLTNILLYKVIAGVTYFVSAVLIWRLIDDERFKLLGTYLWLLSPLTLWELVAVGHNDGLIVLALLLALWAVQRDRHWLAVLALVAGALFKFLPAIFLPLVLLHWLRRQHRWPHRLRTIAVAGVLVAIPMIVLYVPFWDVPNNFAQLGIVDQIKAIWQGRTTTLRNIRVREGFLNASPLATISYLLRLPSVVTSINALRTQFGLAATTDINIRNAISTFGTWLLGLGLVWQSWQIWFRQRPLLNTFRGLLLWYLIAGSQWFQPWYLIWLLALVALRPDRTSVTWLTAWAMMAQASYLLQYFVLPWLEVSGQTLQAQVLYLLLIYPAPLLVWWLMRSKQAQRQPPPDLPLTPRDTPLSARY